MARLEPENLYDLTDKGFFNIPIYERNYDWNEKVLFNILSIIFICL